MSGNEVLCRCGEYIHPTNWALGPGWAHQDGSSCCRVLGQPADREAGRKVLAAYAKRIGVPLR